MSNRLNRIVAIGLLITASFPTALAASTMAQDATPVVMVTQGPPPATGPGSDEVVYPGARMQHYGESARTGFWLWEPTSDGAGTAPVESVPMPVILHFNGCCGDQGYTTPEELELWFKHLAQQGYVVIAPVYKDFDVLGTSLPLFADALEELAKPGHAAIDLERFAVTAYSFGGNAATTYTSNAAAEGLPVPDALFVMAPCVGRFCPEVPTDLTLPTGLKAVVMAFDIDSIVGVEWPQRLYAELMDLPAADRNYVELRSDGHGSPAILGGHWAALEPIDSAERWGIWKISSALLDCTFNGNNCQYALGNTPEQRNMGTWSDGASVLELYVSEDPVADAYLPPADVDAKAETFATFDSKLETPRGIGAPEGLDIADDGTIYVVDSLFDRIQMFDKEGVFLDTFGEAGSGEGQFVFHQDFGKYGDIAISEDGSIYVVDTFNARVQKFDADLQFLTQFGNDAGAAGEFVKPSGIAVDNANSRVFVTDFDAGLVNIYDLDGGFVESWGQAGPGSPRFTWPTDVAVGPDGTVYVAEMGRAQVHLFTGVGAPVARWGGTGDEPGRFTGVWGLDVDTAGNVYVAEYDGNRVQVFSSDGTVIGLLDSLAGSAWVTVAADGTIYVTEETLSQISKFVPGVP